MYHCHFRTLGEICPHVYISLYLYRRNMSSCLFLSSAKMGEICPNVYNAVFKTGELCPGIINGWKCLRDLRELGKSWRNMSISLSYLSSLWEKYVPMLVMPSSNTGELCLRMITHLLDIGRNIYLDNAVPGYICTR